MKIHVGSTNDSKVNAVKEIIQDYDSLRDADVRSFEASSDVSSQPTSIEETIKGAINRAKKVFKGADYAIGIESGLMKIPYTKTGYMDVTACAIYDGKEFHIGLSSAFEYPKDMTRLVFEKGLTISEAARKTGLSKNPKLGKEEGVIGILTKGRMPRKEYTKQALRTALIHLEHRHLW